ncbi:AAA family ATPase [Bacillaceae bacterium Marseille-Q3522]|nr:AAA family ATPase [Bacillaceae bacterium Marseille-Q3522]
MICQKCHENMATIELKMNVNGNESHMHLCPVCYQEEKQKLGMGAGPFLNQFSGFTSSPFDQLMQGNPVNQGGQKQTSERRSNNNGFLDHFGRNLNQLAQAGLIDPVIGRDKEIARVIEILNRRNKNNPVLIGEPGVGKTAIAEGLALKIAEGSVPNKLKNKLVYLLDVASLVANTGIRGQFEDRMKKIIGELQSRKNVILFIDEIHLLVGAGSAEGSMDAGNILKPALARGELQVVGATTLKEYRQIEKDAALERRFQPIVIQEPSIAETILILKGLQEKYEKYHEVTYSDEAIEACAFLSHRYIQDRFLPDKAIDLMDEAGSKLNLTINHTSTADIEKRLKEIAEEKKAVLQQENYEQAAKLHQEEQKLEQSLHQQSGSREDVKLVVQPTDIQEIVEEKTGIPVGKLHDNEQQKLKNLEQQLGERVIGQKEAVAKVAKAIRRSRAGLKAKNRPIGSFLFVGPTGVGKTELTKTLALELFGSKDAMIRLDMSEYMEKHSISKIIGSPPGYVGHEEAGQLTEKVRRNPYSIILLDEIEKAHPDVQHIFLQIMEDGRLTDSQGRTVSFKDTVIIMTSNAGNAFVKKPVGFGKNEIDAETNLLQSLNDYFKPEFLNRFDSIIAFHLLEKEDLVKIVRLMIKELNETLAEQNVTLTVTGEVEHKITELGYNRTFGARPLRRVIQIEIEDKLADYILDHNKAANLVAQLDNDNIVISEKKNK